MADNNHKLTIDAAWFAELYNKAENTEKICMNCREKNTRGDFESIENERTELKVECLKLKKDRDELKAKLANAEDDGYRRGLQAARDRIAAAERCIEDIASRCDNNGFAFGWILDIIRAYRAAKEAK